MLYITNHVGAAAVGGREQLSNLVYHALEEIFGDCFEMIELCEPEVGAGTPLLERLNGHINGASKQNVAAIVNAISRLEIDQVFLNGSNLGKAAQIIRAAYPAIGITTFFHNCECRFFLGAMREHPSMRALGVLTANYRAERCAVRFSDNRICLNDRDSRQLFRTYGLGSTHILPMAMHDLLPKQLPDAATLPGEKYALFVGGIFYANRQGIEWFVKHVAAKAPIKTYVVGKGFEQWQSALERNGNVKVIGTVDSLVPWYLGAHFVIAPILDGSGMKTKVAEAMMFGKRVVGTPEAFAGYESVMAGVGVCCETPGQFLDALESESARPFVAIHPELRGAYEAGYSFQAARDRLAGILLK